MIRRRGRVYDVTTRQKEVVARLTSMDGGQINL